MHPRSLFDPHQVGPAAAGENHVVVAGRKQRHPGDHVVVVARLPHLQRADLVQPLGKRGREILRHVLDDDDARRSCRHPGQHGLDGLGPAGGGADRDHLVGGLHQQVLECRASGGRSGFQRCFWKFGRRRRTDGVRERLGDVFGR